MKPTWVCHHCGRHGHIRPYSLKLDGNKVNRKQLFPKWNVKPNPYPQQLWRVKPKFSGHIFCTSLRVSSREDW